MRVIKHEFVYRMRKKRASSLEETRNFFANKDGKETFQRKNSERCWSKGHPPPLGREAQKGFSVGLLGLSRKARFDFGWKDGTFTVNEWEGCFSLLVQILQTCLHLATHVHLPSLDFFFFSPTELRKEKSNSRNVRRKISLRSDDTWPMLKVVGKRTLRLANCIRVFSTM